MAWALLAPAAFAQDAEGPAGLLDEVMVTATRQNDTVNRVPLSITAITQRNLDEQGVRDINDLARTVPSLAIQSSLGSGDRVPTISIRGIASSIGAQTTGIYLDDTPLQKRNAIGLAGNGSPIPLLFDLERVEVLRGPQGTLYGGSSQGGTIRFITPAPSLTRYGGYGKGEIATTKDGAMSYELGVAVGGPIVQDKLGFRVSAWARRTGGYIDHVDRFTGRVIGEDTNYRDAWAIRAAVLWQPNENLKVTPALYSAFDRQADSDVFWSDIPQQTVAARTTAGFTHPAFTYGPYDMYGPYNTGVNCNVGDNFRNAVPQCVGKQPRKVQVTIPSVTVDYQLGDLALKSITSYLWDEVKGKSDYSYQQVRGQSGGYFMFDLPIFRSNPLYWNSRQGLTQEFRLSSDPMQRLSFVAGAFYSALDSKSHFRIVANWDDLQRTLFNQTNLQRLGVPVEAGNVINHRDQRLDETELAGFGEANYLLTQKLKLIAGVRVTRSKFSYDQYTAGTINGFIEATVANGGLTRGTVKETPVTPKFGVQYQISERNMVYATAAKGFRVGGVNQPPPAVRCAADLTQLGITSTPSTYDSDNLWSYEAGAKLRTFGGKAQINTSLFYIDWNKVQVNYQLPTCGFGYTLNAGSAVSKGVDLQAEVRPFAGLTLTAQAAYTNARYTADVVGPAPRLSILVDKGARLPVAPWMVNVGARYDFTAPGGHDAFVRADYQYASSYNRGFGPRSASYSPDSYIAEATDFVTARAGITIKGVEASVFVDNLFNSQDLLGVGGGRGGCAAATGAACTTFTSNLLPFDLVTFRPRTVGLTLNYRY